MQTKKLTQQLGKIITELEARRKVLTLKPVAYAMQRSSNVCGGFLDGTLIEVPVAGVEHFVDECV